MIQDDASKLERWANVGERDAPVVFVGREREIELVVAQLATWQPGLSAGRTIIAQGAPGAGKTALLRRIGRQLLERLPNAATIYRATPWNGRSARNVLQALAVQMLDASADEFRATTGTVSSIGARAVASARHSRSRSTAPPLVACWDDLDTLYADRADRAKPTLLLADEIQRLGDDEETRDLLYHLHDQTTFPVVLVCGGLSTSAAHLRGLGLSRLADANVLRIGALTAEQAQRCLDESLRMMADDVGIDGHPDRWARQLAPGTHGWPQHITCHIRAVATALRTSGRTAFDDGNLDRALALAQAAMREYYAQRLETAHTDVALIFAVYEVVQHDRADADAAADAVEKVATTLPGHRRQRYEAFADAFHCLQQMLHAGVIGYAGNTTASPLSIPIPSLAAHVAGLLSADERERVRRTLGLAPAPTAQPR